MTLSSDRWLRVNAKVLAELGVGVVATDADGVVLHQSAVAEALLADFTTSAAIRIGDAVAPAIADAARASARGHSPVRVETEDGTLAVFVTATRMVDPPIEYVIWLRAERVRAHALFQAMAQFGLTKRELQLAQLICLGLRNRDIARRLRLAEGTVRQYVSTVLNKCDVSSRTELVALISTVERSIHGI